MPPQLRSTVAVRTWPKLRVAWKNLVTHHSDQKATLVEQMDSEHAWASIDHFRMEQVFRNLFENSLAACSGPAEITVRSENWRQRVRYTSLSPTTVRV